MPTQYSINIEDVRCAQTRISSFLKPTPLRHYAALDRAIGKGIEVWVKHENFNATNAFKVRNGVSALTALTEAQKKQGVLAATRGNHGLGLAWAGKKLGVPVTICVPLGNNPEKNEAIQALGATLIETGKDYDEAAAVAAQLEKEKELHTIHGTNNRDVIAGAGTVTLEMLEEEPQLDALVMAIGGGSMATGAIAVARALKPSLEVYGVQAEKAPAIHDSWHAKECRTSDRADTFADGVATRSPYEGTFEALIEGLSGFVLVSESHIAQTLRLAIQTTHHLVEPAGVVGLAGVTPLANRLKGKRVGVVLSGSNIDMTTLRQVLNREI